MGPRGRLALGAAAVLTAAAILGLATRRSADHVVQAGFWFDGLTFAVPSLDRRGESLTALERARIVDVASQTCAAAFADWRLDVVDAPRSHYRVRVVQRFEGRRRTRMFAVAETRVAGPLGGEGAIDFTALAEAAVTLAPAGTTRDELVAAIGRGIGRVAAHELAHQILPHRDFHRSPDPASYDFSDVYREAHFFGPMRWDLAGPWLDAALGRRLAPGRPAAAPR